MNGFAERPRGAGAAAALGCLAGLAYGAAAAAFFFDRYSVVKNVCPPPEGGRFLAFSACLILAYGTIGTCAGALAAAAGRLLRCTPAGRRGCPPFLTAAALGLFAWVETAAYLNGYSFAFEWGRRVYLRGWQLRAALVDPRVLAANALLLGACLAAFAVVWILLARSRHPNGRAAWTWAAFLFATLAVPVNYRLPESASPASCAANAALGAGCVATGWFLAAAWGRLRGTNVGRLAWCVPAALVMFLLCGRDSQAKTILFFRSPVAARLCLRTLNAAFDPDRDFFGPLAPVRDCDNWNGKINPLAVDLPGNGLDEDCTGGDFTREEFDRLRREDERRRAYNAAADRDGARLREERWGTQRPDIFILLVDALRSDHVSLNGYPRRTTPQMDDLFREGTYFPRCVCPSPGTGPSISSILTSLHPSELPGEGAGAVPTLQASLKEAGYFTASFQSITPPFPGLPPLLRGDFDIFSEPGDRGRYHIGAGEVTADVERLLDERPPGRPLFVLVCYSDTHAAYPAPPPFSSMFGAATGVQTIFIPRPGELAWMTLCYDRAVAYADSEVGKLMRRLGERGILERAAVVLTSDHGEEFFEHGGLYHGAGLHAEATTVPLAFLPSFRGARTVPDPVQSVDIMPTLLSLAGAPVPADISGWNLVPALAGVEAPRGRDLVSETLGKPPSRLMALTRGGFKLIHDFYSGTNLLYNAEEDPCERRDLAAAEPARAAEMQRGLFDLKSYLELARLKRRAEGGDR